MEAVTNLVVVLPVHKLKASIGLIPLVPGDWGVLMS